MKVFELLNSEDKWTKTKLWHFLNRNDPEKEHNGKWCVATAILHCYSLDDNVLQKVDESIGISRLGIWNDTSNYQTIVSKLKELDI